MHFSDNNLDLIKATIDKFKQNIDALENMTTTGENDLISALRNFLQEIRTIILNIEQKYDAPKSIDLSDTFFCRD